MLEDVLADDLAVVFCGTNAGDQPTKVEAYYAGRGNKFWPVLHRTRLTPRQFRPEESSMVLAHDIGLADLVKIGKGDGNPRNDDYDVEDFRKKVVEYKPAIIAFNGKEAAKRCLGLETVAYGRRKSTYENSVVYVLPSTADRANDYWDESHWVALAAEVRKLRKG